MSRPSIEEINQVAEFKKSFGFTPNLVTDVYKNRRGELTEIKIFRYFDYGTCRVTDLFMTDSYYNLKTNYERLTQKQTTLLVEDFFDGN